MKKERGNNWPLSSEPVNEVEPGKDEAMFASSRNQHCNKQMLSCETFDAWDFTDTSDCIYVTYVIIDYSSNRKPIENSNSNEHKQGVPIK